MSIGVGTSVGISVGTVWSDGTTTSEMTTSLPGPSFEAFVSSDVLASSVGGPL